MYIKKTKLNIIRLMILLIAVSLISSSCVARMGGEVRPTETNASAESTTEPASITPSPDNKYPNGDSASAMPTVTPNTVQDPNKGEPVSVDKFVDQDTSSQKWKFKNYAVSASEITVSNSRFNMKIPPNTVYPKNIEAFILNCMDMAERASGFSFYPAGKNYPKINIVIESGTYAYGNAYEIHVGAMDLIVDERSTPYVYTHELSHVLDYRNAGTFFHAPFAEAFAILNAYRGFEITGETKYQINTLNYAHFDKDNELLADPENYYINVKDWDAYLAGFRFGVYLEKTYGSNIFPEIMKRYAEQHKDTNRSVPELISAIKDKTSENVFSDFSVWYEKNKGIFNSTPEKDPSDAVQGISEVLIMPIINDHYQGYVNYKYLKGDSLALDFNDGFALAEYHGYMIQGITATFYSEGENIIYFLDSEDKLIDSKKMNNEFANYSVPNASKLRIEGDPGLMSIRPILEKMK